MTKGLIQKTLLLFLLLADVCFFTLPGISNVFSSFSTYHNKILCAIISFIMLLYTIYCNDKKFVFMSRKTEWLLIFYTLVVAIVFIVSAIHYNSFSFSFFRQYYYYFIPFVLVFSLISNIEKNTNLYDYLINAVVIVGTIYAIYAIAQYFLYEASGTIIMNDDLQLFSQRNGHLRLARVADFVGLSTVLSSVRLLNKNGRKKSRWLYLLGCISGLIVLLLVAQTRIYQLAVLATVIFILYKSQRNSLNRLAIFILVIVALFFMADSIQDFIQGIISTSNNYSTENRLAEYIYYFGHFWDHYLFGIGFVPSSISKLLYGPTLQYTLTDCGYIGFLCTFGLAGVILIITAISIFGGETIMLFRQKIPNEENLMYCGLILYLLITNISVSMTDPQRTVIGSLIITIIMYNKSKLIDSSGLKSGIKFLSRKKRNP